jgi:hypothetical protein
MVRKVICPGVNAYAEGKTAQIPHDINSSAIDKFVDAGGFGGQGVGQSADWGGLSHQKSPPLH